MLFSFTDEKRVEFLFNNITDHSQVEHMELMFAQLFCVCQDEKVQYFSKHLLCVEEGQCNLCLQ